MPLMVLKSIVTQGGVICRLSYQVRLGESRIRSLFVSITTDSTNTCGAALEVGIVVFLRANTFHWKRNDGDSELFLKLTLRPQSRVKYTTLRTDCIWSQIHCKPPVRFRFENVGLDLGNIVSNFHGLTRIIECCLSK